MQKRGESFLRHCALHHSDSIGAKAKVIVIGFASPVNTRYNRYIP